ncbi:MAG TPA: uroporphyrinogen-III synthase [Thermoanaerobaculia bacterium]|nr:uroporphyrinogen-III synthase [Thermoanaerobaculia bacterium]
MAVSGTGHVGSPMRGARVALLEARMESELAALVRRHGGEPVCVPALREVERDCADEVARAYGALACGNAVIVLTTGVGLARLLRVGDSIGLAKELRVELSRATVVCRGPKPVAVLKREGLPFHVRAEPPHTTAELVAALAGVDVSGKDVVFVHDGGGGRDVVVALEKRGARVIEVRPYAWALPEDIGPLRTLVENIICGEVDAVAFTTQVQARHLFAVADAVGSRDALARAMAERVVVAAVGPTCARALTQLGAPPHVVPGQGKMGAMVVALAGKLG